MPSEVSDLTALSTEYPAPKPNGRADRQDRRAADPHLPMAARLDLLLGTRLSRLSLPPDIMALFKQNTDRAGQKMMVSWCTWIAIVNLSCGIFDLGEATGHKLAFTLAVRVTIGMIFLLAAQLAKRSGLRAFRPAIIIAPCVISAIIGNMVAVTVQSSELFLIYMMMSVMVVYTAIMFLPLELRHATALAVMTLIPVTYFVLIAQLQSSAEKLQLLVFLSGVMAALLQARRIQNIYAHRVFLLQKRDELRTNEVNRLNEQLAGMAYMDRLTDIPNRRFFEEKAEAMMAAPCEYQPLALCLMDIDHFKNLNDRLGHQQGDRCLQMVASTLREHLRAKSDILARYGGEEFVLLLPATNSAAATQLLDRLRLAVRDLHLPNPGTANGSITISAGLAMSDGGAFDMEELLKQADAALYRAKSAGRNQVCV